MSLSLDPLVPQTVRVIYLPCQTIWVDSEWRFCSGIDSIPLLTFHLSPPEGPRPHSLKSGKSKMKKKLLQKFNLGMFNIGTINYSYLRLISASWQLNLCIHFLLYLSQSFSIFNMLCVIIYSKHISTVLVTAVHERKCFAGCFFTHKNTSPFVNHSFP